MRSSATYAGREARHSVGRHGDWRDRTTVAAGYRHTVGLKNEGRILATGDRTTGACDVNQWEDVVTLAAGSYHTVGVTAFGGVLAAGDNRQGQCGVGDWQNIVAVAAGSTHTLGLCIDDTVVSAGTMPTASAMSIPGLTSRSRTEAGLSNALTTQRPDAPTTLPHGAWIHALAATSHGVTADGADRPRSRSLTTHYCRGQASHVSVRDVFDPRRGYPSVVPYVRYRDPDQAMSWLSAVVGAREAVRMTLPDGRIGHAELRHGDHVITVGLAVADDETDRPADRNAVHAMTLVFVPDVDAATKRAGELGGTIVDDPTDMPWGLRQSIVADPEGHVWELTTYQREVSATVWGAEQTGPWFED